MSVQKPSHKQYRISGHRILIKLRKKGERQQQPTTNSQLPTAATSTTSTTSATATAAG